MNSFFFFAFWSMATSAPADHTKYKIPKPVGPYHVPSGQLPPAYRTPFPAPPPSPFPWEPHKKLERRRLAELIM